MHDSKSCHGILCCIIQVAYHGTPLKTYEVFTTALKAQYLEKGLVLPLVEEQNPAGKVVLELFSIVSSTEGLTTACAVAI